MLLCEPDVTFRRNSCSFGQLSCHKRHATSDCSTVHASSAAHTAQHSYVLTRRAVQWRKCRSERITYNAVAKAATAPPQHPGNRAIGRASVLVHKRPQTQRTAVANPPSAASSRCCSSFCVLLVLHSSVPPNSRALFKSLWCTAARYSGPCSISTTALTVSPRGKKGKLHAAQ